ncbi:MAG: CHRD domain-containing protein [Verrucomicrobia bacterium]|nr:CHRD domain-containing protein [Verrucomicrobiota bacterium]
MNQPDSQPAVKPTASQLLDAALLEITGLALQAAWTGGKGPYLVQLKPNLDGAAWINLLTTTNTTATVLRSGDTGFLRVGSRATTTVLPLTAWLAGANEIPPVESQGLGLATLSLEGTVTLSATDQDLLLTGRTYINIHSSAHGSGEIRGQIAPIRWQTQLTGDAEVPPVTTDATGGASLGLVGNQLFWRLSYANLTGPAQAAHLHGPAAPNENAPPLVTFTLPATATGSAQGSATLDPATLRAFIDGRTYINIHTPQHPSGEIRGQVQPTP